MKQKMIIVSGYFNPIHKGHLELFKKSKEAGDVLCVIVNSDHQRSLKGSKEFMSEDERLLIVESIKYVYYGLISIDEDKTQIKTIEHLYNKFSNEFDIFFANGGDQNNNTIPERPICEELGVGLIDGLGDKIQSSSWLLK